MGTVGLVGGLVSFAPTENAFADLPVPDGSCEPFTFVEGDCTGQCGTTSCCGVIIGLIAHQDYICCESDAVNAKFPNMRIEVVTPGETPILSPGDLIGVGCCVPC